MTWKYLGVLNECIKILLTIGFGILASWLQVFESEAFVSVTTKFVFQIALPCLVVQGLGIGIDFYTDALLWNYIGAYLLLRAIFLVISLVLAAVDRSKGIGHVAVYWLSFTWISTVILGVPISAALFGDPDLGKKYGILAGVSSFIFQLPLQLFFLECHALKQSRLIESNRNGHREKIEKDAEECDEEDLEEVDIGGDNDRANSSDQGQQRHIWKTISLQVLYNPVLWAIAVGFVVTLSTIGPRFLNPTSKDYTPSLGWIFITLDWFGACVSPLSLFAMGVWMQKEWRTLFGIPWWSAVLYMLSKLVIVPLIMAFLAKALRLDNQSGRAAVLIAALPISQASFVLASRYKIGEAVLSENVAVGTILILPTILIWNLVLDALDVFPIS